MYTLRDFAADVDNLKEMKSDGAVPFGSLCECGLDGLRETLDRELLAIKNKQSRHSSALHRAAEPMLEVPVEQVRQYLVRNYGNLRKRHIDSA